MTDFFVFVFLATIGTTIFYRKRDKKKFKISLIICIICFFAIGASPKPKNTDNKKSDNKVVKTVKTKTTKKQTSNKQKSQNKKADKKPKTDKKKKDDKPKYKEYTTEANKQFCDYYLQELQNSLKQNGLNIAVKVEYVDNALMCVIVPQEFKYASNTDIQYLADNVLKGKNQLFNQWASSNNYNPKDNPNLTLKSEDGTELAVESVFSKTMKRKVNN